MCEFKSAIVVQDEREKGGFRLCLSPWTESHDELEKIFHLHEGKSLKFAKVEFRPPDIASAHLPATYKLKIDEERTPDWFTKEVRESVIEKMTDYIKSIIVSGDADILIGGQFIVCGKSKIGFIKNAIIYAISGSAQVEYISDSAQVEYIYGSAQVESISGSAQVESIYGSAQVKYISDSAQVESISGSAQVESIYGSAQV
jgi:hypothetical protein